MPKRRTTLEILKPVDGSFATGLVSRVFRLPSFGKVCLGTSSIGKLSWPIWLISEREELPDQWPHGIFEDSVHEEWVFGAIHDDGQRDDPKELDAIRLDRELSDFEEFDDKDTVVWDTPRVDAEAMHSTGGDGQPGPSTTSAGQPGTSTKAAGQSKRKRQKGQTQQATEAEGEMQPQLRRTPRQRTVTQDVSQPSQTQSSQPSPSLTEPVQSFSKKKRSNPTKKGEGGSQPILLRRSPRKKGETAKK
ncbi:hypothetical protein CJ030_MR8G026782 [Morella rubra]|uniref:Uncharacterized protein n=1 Tax=Morella rubra TaxID=262757 RepID=A0A6A1USY5_9ROSI|nr:hypothetical protein CJ030_MR8G026782 [Morella rubra]